MKSSKVQNARAFGCALQRRFSRRTRSRGHAPAWPRAAACSKLVACARAVATTASHTATSTARICPRRECLLCTVAEKTRSEHAPAGELGRTRRTSFLELETFKYGCNRAGVEERCPGLACTRGGDWDFSGVESSIHPGPTNPLSQLSSATGTQALTSLRELS